MTESDGAGPTTDSAASPQCASTADCPTGPACHLAACSAKGQCTYRLQADGLPCDAGNGCAHVANSAACNDQNACTGPDACQKSQCFGAKKTCDDGNPCSDDSCEVALGCAHVDNKAACDDGNPCTSKDACSSGSCASGAAVVCDDSKACTDDTCDVSAGCVASANTKACDDGVACTISDTCANGKCSGTVNCTDNNVCTDDSCVTGSCSYAANAGVCDDLNRCTAGEACKGGNCKPATVVVCDDGDVCTDDYCDQSGGCKTKINTAPCTKLGSCANDDVCVQGKCTAGATSRLGNLSYGATWLSGDFETGNENVDVLYSAVQWDATSYAALGFSAYNWGANERNATVMRVNANGSLQWKVHWYDVGTVAVARAGYLRPDGKLMVTGFGGNGVGKWLAVVDGQGKRESLWAPKTAAAVAGWSQHVGWRTLDGQTQYVVCGDAKNNWIKDAHVIVQDASGIGIKEKLFGNGNGNNNCAATFAADTNGGLWYFGDGNNSLGPGLGGTDGVFGKLDKNLNLTVLKHYGGAKDDYLSRVVARPQGGWLVAGTTYSSSADGSADGWVLAVDHKGKLLWQYTVGGALADEAWGVRALADGSSVMVGALNENTSQRNVFAARLNPLGAPMWAKSANLSGNALDIWHDVIVLADGDLRPVGYRYVAATAEQFLISRMDPWGALSCLDAGACAGLRYKDCDDGNYCSNDYCDFSSGCKSLSGTSKCEDGNACTEQDVCVAGSVCKTGTLKVCDDSNPCTTETCAPKQCAGHPRDPQAACQITVVVDGAACGAGKTCQVGQCL